MAKAELSTLPAVISAAVMAYVAVNTALPPTNKLVAELPAEALTKVGLGKVPVPLNDVADSTMLTPVKGTLPVFVTS